MASPISRTLVPTITVVAVLSVCFLTWMLFERKGLHGQAQVQESAIPIRPPAITLSTEAESEGITKFSFIAYGDTRGRRDGAGTQYEHSLVIDSMLTQIEMLKKTAYPVNFVLQSA